MGKDLNNASNLFGGIALAWIDEAALIFATELMDNHKCVTKYISEIEFLTASILGDVIEIRVALIKTGKTSLTFSCEMFNVTKAVTCLSIDKMTFVSLNWQNQPTPHRYYVEQLEQDEAQSEQDVSRSSAAKSQS